MMMKNEKFQTKLQIEEPIKKKRAGVIGICSESTRS